MKLTKSTFFLGCLVGGMGAALVPLLFSPSRADTKLLPFQGRLTDAAGTPIPDGAKVVEFKMYDAPTGGNLKNWAGEVHKLSVNGGLVNTMLGSKASLDEVDFSKPTYLQITIDANIDDQITAADPPLLPRQSVVPAVYAVQAGNSARLLGHDWKAFFGSNDPTSIVFNRLTASDGAPGNALTVDAEGSVGIGTQTPNQTLHVQGNGIRVSGVNPTIYFDPTGTGATAALGAATLNGGGLSGAAPNDTFLTGLTTGNLLLGIGYEERMRISTSGNVGIGTATPQAKLDVQGNAIVSGTLTTAGLAGAFQIGTANISDGSVTQSKMASRETGATVGVGGFAVSASSGGFGTTTKSVYQAIPALGVTLASTGRPVFVGLMHDGVGSTATFAVDGGTDVNVGGRSARLRLMRNTTDRLAEYGTSILPANYSGVPASSCWSIHALPAGTHNFTVMIVLDEGGRAYVSNAKLVAYEL